MMKKLSFYFLSVIIFLFLLLLIDFFISNTFIKYKNCIKYEEFFYELKKNCRSKYRFKKSFPIVEVITDEMGLRVGKKSLTKKNDKKNIFIFGDSFTYGVGIEYEKTFVGLLEKDLSLYNIYNFAVSSYSPSVYLFQLEQSLKKNIIPEKILIFLDLTDLLDEATRWDYNETGNIKLQDNLLYKSSKKRERFLKKNFKMLNNISSYINYFLRDIRERANIKLNNKRKIKTSIQGSFTYTDINFLDKRYWEKENFLLGEKILKKRLSQISNIAKRNNIEFYLIIYPWAETLEFGQKTFNWSEYAKSICSNNNCKLIDAIPDFLKYKNDNFDWSRELYFLNDEHFNEKGAYLLYSSVIKNLKQ